VTRSIVVVTAGLSEQSSTSMLADRLATESVAALAKRDVEATSEIIELRPLAHDLTNNLLTGFAAGPLVAALRSVREADGVIAVTPVFSASYSGLFKTFFDVLEVGALDGKPVLMAATAGTSRHSLMLEHTMRPLFSYLRAVIVPTAVLAASEDWGSAGGVSGELSTRIARAAGQLGDLVAGLPNQQVKRDRFADVPDFETLLNA
jgi:FMN reductase